MAKYAHPDVLDGGLNAIKSAAIRVLLIKNFTIGDSYATVVANKISEAVTTSTDYTLATVGNTRTLTSAVKSATATATSGINHHIAFTNGVDKVLWVTDETGEAVVAVNDTTNIPALVYTANQPI
jgi:hypothetical protein